MTPKKTSKLHPVAKDLYERMMSMETPIFSLEEISNHYGVRPKVALAAFEQARKQANRGTLATEESVPSAYENDILKPHRKEGDPINIEPFFHYELKFAGTADSHLVSPYHLGDAKTKTGPLWDLYRACEREGITTVFHGGNWIDGSCRFNQFEVRATGVTAQMKIFLHEYPYVPGVRTAFISGDDHEGWWWKSIGLDIAEYAALMARQEGRDDMDFIGYMEAHVLMIPGVGFRYNRYLADERELEELREFIGEDRPMPDGQQGPPNAEGAKEYATLLLAHGGGGTGYAKSYQPQKIIGSYESGEKPQILLIGHYHKASYDWLRNAHVVQLGTTEEQSGFMRKKTIPADVGYYLFQANQAPTGEINRFEKRFVPYVIRGPNTELRKYTLRDGR